MKLPKKSATAGILFSLVLAFRLLIAFRTPTLDYEAYFHLAQIHSILDTGTPIFTDLWYAPHYFFPGFDYVLSFFALFMDPVIVLKIVPNVMAATLVLVVFALSLRISKNALGATFSGLLAGFVPIFVASANSASPLTMAIPLLFFLIYCFLRINEKTFAYTFLVSAVVLAVTHPIALLLVASLSLYLGLSKLERLQRYPQEFEVTFFIGLLTTWITFLVFKKPLLSQGIAAVWQNVPTELFPSRFDYSNILEALTAAGLLGALVGLWVIYRLVLRQRKREIYLVISPVLTLLAFISLGVTDKTTALSILGGAFAILFGSYVAIISRYVRKTNFVRYRSLVYLAILTLILLAHVMPSWYMAHSSEYPSPEDVEGMRWIGRSLPQDAIIVASLNEGYMVVAEARRQNILDPFFLFASDVEERFNDIETMYTTPFETEVIPLLTKYDADYVFVSQNTADDFEIERLQYASNKKCFSLLYNQGPLIYESLCEVSS